MDKHEDKHLSKVNDSLYLRSSLWNPGAFTSRQEKVSYKSNIEKKLPLKFTGKQENNRNPSGQLWKVKTNKVSESSSQYREVNQVRRMGCLGTGFGHAYLGKAKESLAWIDGCEN